MKYEQNLEVTDYTAFNTIQQPRSHCHHRVFLLRSFYSVNGLTPSMVNFNNVVNHRRARNVHIITVSSSRKLSIDAVHYDYWRMMLPYRCAAWNVRRGAALLSIKSAS